MHAHSFKAECSNLSTMAFGLCDLVEGYTVYHGIFSNIPSLYLIEPVIPYPPCCDNQKYIQILLDLTEEAKLPLLRTKAIKASFALEFQSFSKGSNSNNGESQTKKKLWI